MHRLFERVERTAVNTSTVSPRSRTLSVGLHRRSETVPIEGAVALGGERLEEFRRKAVGRVQLGGVGPGHRLPPAWSDLGEELLDPVEAAVDRAEEDSSSRWMTRATRSTVSASSG